MQRVGVLSDTHGLLRPEAVIFLRGCDRIVHGGDIGRSEILEELRSLAPVTAVRGNNDRGVWADQLHETQVLEVDAVLLYVVHDLARLDSDPAAAGFRVVISGHSHKPRMEKRDGVLYFNPGSCGPRRFKLPVSVGELTIDGDELSGRLVELKLR
jgi:putative phosphoesterase